MSKKKEEYVIINNNNVEFWSAELWENPFKGPMLATTKWYGTRGQAVAAAKRIFRRQWDRNGKVTK